MSGLTRTDLATNDKVQLAAAAVVWQGEHGIVTELADEYGVSRPTVYSARDQAYEALVAQFDARMRKERLGSFMVARRQLERAVLGLRVMGINSIRAIEGLIPVLHPGVSASYGMVEGMLVEAEARAGVMHERSGRSAREGHERVTTRAR
jgi:hypothetical protein